MMAETQIALETEMQRRARQRANDLGVSLANTFRRLVAGDLARPETVPIELFESSALEQFERNGEEKLRAIDKVAPPKSPWFLNQSKKPFSSALSHPAGRLASPS